MSDGDGSSTDGADGSDKDEADGSDKDETDFFDTEQFVIDMEKALAAARKAKAIEWLESERVTAAKDGGDTSFVDALLADLDAFVADNLKDLDALLKAEKGGQVGDEMDIEKGSNKRNVHERDDDGTGDEQMN